MSNFKRIGDILIPNPKVAIKKGDCVNYIPMEEISPNNRYVAANQRREYNGGTRFEHNDIIFARITPCLQNRKIGQYISETLSPACGSTEYFVFRSIPNVSDSSYLYYLLKSDLVVETAINSMKGASGRQRAEIQAILDLEIEVPDYKEQIEIGKRLSVYDSLIENNNRRIAILEEMAQRLYREWFVHFRFPGHEDVKMVESELGLIPEGWEVCSLKKIITRVKKGIVYTENDVFDSGMIPVIDQSSSEVLGYHDNSPDLMASIQSPIGIFGDHTCKMQLIVRPFSVGPNVIPFLCNEKHKLSFVYFSIMNLIETREYKRHWNDLTTKQVLLSTFNLEEQFDKFVSPILSKIDSLRQKNTILRKTRDHLLPRLISGDIYVSDLPIKTKED